MAPDTVSIQRLTARSYYIVAVSSMEQIIGAALSTVVGVMIPMLQLTLHPEMSPAMQGFVGAISLVGIAIGSAVIGKLSDRHGYLLWFRLCPLLIMAGAFLCWVVPHRGALIAGMIIAGMGVGGGYSLDSAYISELLPPRWQEIMVGAAKGTCVFGFFGAALVCWLILRNDPDPALWHNLILTVGILAALTLALRLRWAESPKWLMVHGREAEAQRAVDFFYGKNSGRMAESPTAEETAKSPGWLSMFHGENLKKVIFSGVPWACEGLGVYGFGVFLPSVVLALGIEGVGTSGMDAILNSVEVTTVVNFFILPGFVIGLVVLNRLNHVKMLTWGLVGSAAGLTLLLAGYVWHLPKVVLILGFVIFEVALNAGPHLITYILPTRIYSVSDRGTGNGIAAMLGKLGAIIGVVLMPVLIDAGGATLVLIVCIGVMLAGALVAGIFGRILKLV